MSRERKRKGRVESRTIKGIQQQPWKQPLNRYAPFEIASADQIEEIHQASLRILRELGIAFLDDEALDILNRTRCRSGSFFTNGEIFSRID